MRHAGFTLLEVVIALAVLAVALFVLVDAQAGAVFATGEGQRLLVLTSLAQEKMAEVQMRVEKEGFTDADIEEEGTFEDFGINGEYGDGVDLRGEFDDYKWAYTIRRVDLSGGDIAGAMSEAAALMGTGEEEGGAATQTQSTQETMQERASSILQPDQLTEMLSPFIREVRVLVWTGEEPEDVGGCQNCVELTTHVVNSSGQVLPGVG